MHVQKLVAFILGAAIVAFGISQIGFQKNPQEKTMSADDMVARGKYLVDTIGGCADCHSPKIFTDKGPEPDMAKFLSGHPAGSELPEIDPNLVTPDKWMLVNPQLTAFVGPWGVTFAANLTPDEQTGIGLWKEENFIQAMRTGKHMGTGRLIMPPMPWFNLAKATDEDLQAMFAYLKSLPPVKNLVPGPMPLAELAGQ